MSGSGAPASGGTSGPAYHEVEWHAEAVRRFWEFQAANPAGEASFFARRFAPRIAGLAARHRALADPVIDLGSGPGFLAAELARRGARCLALDGARSAAVRASARLSAFPGSVGAAAAALGAIPLRDGTAGTAFLVEVLEHLPAAGRVAVLAEVARVLRPGGHVVVTVPNEEDLDALRVACPECGCVFHRVQHLASLDARGLRADLETAGLEPQFVEALDLRHFPDLAIGLLVRRAAGAIPALRRPRPPHLVAIARRRPT